MEMLIGGRWQRAASGRTEDVTSPFDGSVAGTVAVPKVEAIRTGAPRSGQTTMGTLIAIPEAERVEGSIRRAVVDVAVSSAGDWESAIAQALGGGRDDRHQDRHPARPTLVKEDRQ